MTESDDDVGILVLSRATYRNAPHVVAGSVVITANCGHRAFISPQAAMFQENDERGRTSYTTCDDCFTPDRFQEMLKNHEVLGVPGSLESARAHLSSEELARFEEWSQKHGIREVDE